MVQFFKRGILASIVVAGSAYAAEAQEVTKRTTPNGHVYWHYPIEKAKRTAVAIAWPSGISTLPSGQEMIARIGIDMMLNGGADGKLPEEIVAEFEDLDAGSRLFVQPEEIRGFIVAPDEEIQKAAEIANRVLARPNLSKEWLERERNKLAGASRGRDKVVLGIGWNLSREIIMSDHPYKNFWSIRPVANIEAASLETIKDWHSKAFRKDDVLIAATGSANFDVIDAGIDIALKDSPAGKSAPTIPLPDLKVPGKTIVFHAPKAEKSMILIFGKAPAAADNQDLPFNLSLGVLGYGQQSRLFKAVRTGLRASYGFGSGYIDYTRNQRLFQMSGEVETAKLSSALETVRETYEEFRTDGVGLIEFPFARRFYRQRIESSMAKPQEATYLLMEGLLNGAPAGELATLQSRIDNLERGKVNGFISKTFVKFDDLLKIIVTPDAAAVKGDCVITAYEQWRSCL